MLTVLNDSGCHSKRDRKLINSEGPSEGLVQHSADVIFLAREMRHLLINASDTFAVINSRHKMCPKGGILHRQSASESL